MTRYNEQKCTAYFKGIDGLGTCDTDCQYFQKNCIAKLETTEQGARRL